MKNITVSVDNETHRLARIKACRTGRFAVRAGEAVPKA
jgi:hypothetical protein